MTTTTRQDRAQTGTRGLAAVLLSRRGSVYLPGVDAPRAADAMAADPVSSSADAVSSSVSAFASAGVVLLEADLLERGYLLSAPLRAAYTALSPTDLSAAGRALLADLDEALGADRDHTPLFRGFPGSTPQDTYAFYVDRVLTLLLQNPEQPCVLCAAVGTVHAVSPCAHLVCRSCFDGADFAACPVCHRRIDGDDPFLRPAARRPEADRHRALPDRMRVLAFGGDSAARDTAAGEELRGLLGRTAALSPQDADDLAALLDTRSRTDLSWLPESLPGRETKARVLSWLLRPLAVRAVRADRGDQVDQVDQAGPGDRADRGTQVDRPAALAAVTARLDTATDILRLLAVWSGGDPGLVDRPRLVAVPRPVRRCLLAALDALDPALAVPDMRRRRRAWTAAAHALHPFEYATRYPRAALAVAALRDIKLPDDQRDQRDPLGAALRSTAAPLPGIDATGTKVTVETWGGKVESALADGDTAAATALLAQRPGELLRRLDHLLRLAGPDADHVLDALPAALPRVSPAVLLSALGAIRSRRQPPRTRVFFPKGGDARAYVTADERAKPTPAAVEAAVDALTTEVLRRAAAEGPAELAVIDTALDGVIAPFTERTASRALVTLPRGSELALPEGKSLRLFLHWMESAESGTSDLDLSLALFDEQWQHIGTCDYTELRFADTAAVHSGDLTSAPAPAGASEFIDLDLDRLEEAGARYAAVVCFSFNDIPFVELAEAFAGFMTRSEPGDSGPVFDPRSVEQRFDLISGSRAVVTLIVDVPGRTMRWLDTTQGVSGTHHAIHRHADLLAVQGQSLTELFASGARVGLGELATWQAAARAATVAVRHTDGSVIAYRRRDGETPVAFAARIATPDHDDAHGIDLTRADLAYLHRGDVRLADGCEVYALHPGSLDAGSVRLLTAADVVNGLAARG
ncbi:MXAN_6230/SCO0854 family RING domain-containing protein [Streptomyces sp. E11-3]|uniref:MXAN_6230/SCO0854 family RING domain-containing protein n=1 Tax=Streptomyces sp. E11-3 TaxID=3110112 RepID=UPI00398019E2